MKIRSYTAITILVLAALLMSCAQHQQSAKLDLPSLVGDNMVLQQNTEVNIWGWTNPKQKVKVKASWDSGTYSAKADTDGKFVVKVPTVEAGGPYVITIDADTLVALKNIMLGEVWVCSGQSNMEFSLARAESAATEIPQANFPKIRLFTVERTIAPYPLSDCSGEWEECTPETAPRFSAVGYFFGKDLNQKLNVPVGLIHTSWGGTLSEAWTSKEGLEPFDYFKLTLQKLYGNPEENKDMADAFRRADSINAVTNRFFDFMDPNNPGKKGQWMSPGFDDAAWPELECPSEWSTHPEIGIMEGVMWMRKTVDIPADWNGKSLVLELGPVDEMDETWFNGELVGSNDIVDNWNKPRVYEVPAKLVKGNKASIVVRALNKVTEGGFIGKPEQMKLSVKNSGGQQKVSLAGNWKYDITYRMPNLPPLSNPNTPTYLFNGMLHPLIPMTIKGAIWYQGEANVSRAVQYRKLFPAMIQDWRKQWGIGDFPFYFVQLAPYNYGKEYTGAELREAQFMTLSKLPNTGMAVTLDIGNPVDIHPTNKRDVGHRLALWALNRDYGIDVVPSGPLYKNFEVVNSTIKVNFNYAENGLVCKGDSLIDFEIAGNEQVYVPAKAKIEGNSVIVWNDEVMIPVAVRYGWTNTAEPNLFNAEGLPASSFCSDIWKRVTDGVE